MGAGDRAEGPTADQLRAAIDAGETADKAPGVDPAAAPLGTDDEAAGAPPSAPVVAQALAAERKPELARRADRAQAQDRDRNPSPNGWGVETDALRGVGYGVAAALLLGAGYLLALGG